MENWKKLIGIVFLLAAAAAGGLYGTGIRYGFNPVVFLPELLAAYIAGVLAEKAYQKKHWNRVNDRLDQLETTITEHLGLKSQTDEV